MIINTQPEVNREIDGLSVTFSVPDSEIENLMSLVNDIKPGQEYELTVKKKSKKRSADANAYAWKLIGLIARELGLTPLEVYKRQILDTYCYRDVLVSKDYLNEEIQNWSKLGYGWLSEVIGESPAHKGYIWLRKYRGSSSYNSTEMSHFLDNIIFEAQQLGIQTDSKEHLNECKNNWRKKC